MGCGAEGRGFSFFVFEGADRRGRLDSVVVRGGGSSVEGSEGDNFSKGSSLSRS